MCFVTFTIKIIHKLQWINSAKINLFTQLNILRVLCVCVCVEKQPLDQLQSKVYVLIMDATEKCGQVF